jgi:hypothetical protein
MLDQRRRVILSQLQALSSIGGRTTTTSIPRMSMAASQMLQLSQPGVIIPTVTQPLPAFQSQLISLRIQQSLLQQQLAWPPGKLFGHNQVSIDQSQESSMKNSNEGEGMGRN